eukprot:TRINITY_DN47005_c0_g1_i1.p1 TRINITY_DN47005_c0_g1~~TRINITY_DN47005_c0_g1_i1.p1  ORF type:complete len:156 (-),score=16.28 TRINITY_DN47005_c0_g1_i1:18-485(-)
MEQARFNGHAEALDDLQEFVAARQIPYLGQWYSRVALQYLGVAISMNERVEEWADEGRHLIREVHTHGLHATAFDVLSGEASASRTSADSTDARPSRSVVGNGNNRPAHDNIREGVFSNSHEHNRRDVRGSHNSAAVNGHDAFAGRERVDTSRAR